MTTYVDALGRVEYRFADSEWIIKREQTRGRYEYACYKNGARHASKDTLDLAIRYCKRDGRAYIMPWKKETP